MNTTFLFDDPQNIKKQWWLWLHRFAGEETKYRAYLHITKLKVFPLPAGKSRPRTEKGNLENEFDPNHFFSWVRKHDTFFFLLWPSLSHCVRLSNLESQYVRSLITVHLFHLQRISFVSFFLGLSSIIVHLSHLGCTFSKHRIFHYLSVKHAL